LIQLRCPVDSSQSGTEDVELHPTCIIIST